MNSLDLGREDDLALGRGDSCLFKGGVNGLVGTEIDRSVFFPGVE